MVSNALPGDRIFLRERPWIDLEFDLEEWMLDDVHIVSLKNR